MSYPRVEIIDLRPEARKRRRCAYLILLAAAITLILIATIAIGTSLAKPESREPPTASAASACDDLVESS